MRPESLVHPFRKPPFRIGIPQLSVRENAAWENRLQELSSQCGCTAGTVGLTLFVLASLAYLLWIASRATADVPLHAGSSTALGGLFLAGLIGSALLGKLIGLTFAMLRFRQTCRRLLVHLGTMPSA